MTTMNDATSATASDSTAIARRSRLRAFGQEHLLEFENELGQEVRARLYAQIDSLDLDRVSQWLGERQVAGAVRESVDIEPIDAVALPQSDHDRAVWARALQSGVEALRAGRAAVLMVAGGQGTRLGFDQPKGMYPIGPVRGTSLFQIHAEKIAAVARRYETRVPWYIMTSPDTHDATTAFFARHRFFGLPDRDVCFFVQGTTPAIDAASGKILLSDKGEVALSPNGHGGAILAMFTEGILDDMARRGADLLFYFQVDNVFVKILDPEFVGLHVEGGAEFSLKVVRKRSADEKVGVVVRQGGRPTVIEYSDLPTRLAEQRDPDGRLTHWAGSIAIHVFSRAFLERITTGGLSLPIHRAHKKVEYVDAVGIRRVPDQPNAIKFEMFIFDSLPMAERAVVVETDRSVEFEPLKNARGPDSPESVRALFIRHAAAWLERAGVAFPRHADGTPAVGVEISPLAGLDPDEFAARLNDRSPVTAPTYFGDGFRAGE
jgi:UDP-N-acetylglucosamine/UDP-N-acetylgalactosamine diphosphorylase